MSDQHSTAAGREQSRLEVSRAWFIHLRAVLAGTVEAPPADVDDAAEDRSAAS